MTPPTAAPARPAPVSVTIGSRPPATAPAAGLPVTVTATDVPEGGFIIIGDLDKKTESTMCSCNAGDDVPY